MQTIRTGQQWRTRNAGIATVIGIQPGSSWPVLIECEDGTRDWLTERGRRIAMEESDTDLMQLLPT